MQSFLQNVAEVWREAPHSTLQGTHLREERTRHSNNHRSLIKRHLRQSEHDPEDIFGNGSKWKQDSESNSSSGGLKSDIFCTFHLAPRLQQHTTSHQRPSISHFGSEEKNVTTFAPSP